MADGVTGGWPLVFTEIVSETLYQSDLYAAIDLCVYSAKYRAMGKSGTLMLAGVICASHDFRFNYDRDVAALLLPMHDNHDVDFRQFDAAVDFHRRFTPTLVHCKAGRSRSVAVAAAIAETVHGIPHEEVYRRCGSTPTPEVHQSLVRWLRR